MSGKEELLELLNKSCALVFKTQGKLIQMHTASFGDCPESIVKFVEKLETKIKAILLKDGLLTLRVPAIAVDESEKQWMRAKSSDTVFAFLGPRRHFEGKHEQV